MKAEINYDDIRSSATLERLQENLHLLTGLAFDFLRLDERDKQNHAKYEVELCRSVHKIPAGRQACEQCGIKVRDECLATKKPVLHVCHLGLNDVLVPLVVRKKVVGILTAGQFLMEPPNAQDFQKLLKRLTQLNIHIAEAEVEKYYHELPVCSKQKIDAIISLLMDFSVYITDTEHRLMVIQDQRQSNRVNLALEFIKSRFPEAITVKDIATAAHASPSHIRKLFREELGVSPIAYLNNYRLEVSTAMLEKTAMSIIQISYQVGFENVSHYNHLFKKRFGLAPSHYRKSK